MSSERSIHDGLIAFLRKNKLSYCRHRMDKKSGIAEGWPDFTIVHCNRALLIELKTSKGKLSEIQTKVIEQLRDNGTIVVIARSVAQAVEAVEDWLGLRTAYPWPSGLGKGRFQRQFQELRQAVNAVGQDDGHVPGAGCEDLSGGVESRHAEMGSGLSLSPENDSAGRPPRLASKRFSHSESSASPAQNLFVGSLLGTDYVFRRDVIGATMLHKADQHDLVSLPRLSSWA